MTSAKISGYAAGWNADSDISAILGTGRGDAGDAERISFASVMQQRGAQAQTQQFAPEARPSTGATGQKSKTSEPAGTSEQFKSRDKTPVRNGNEGKADAVSVQEKAAEAEHSFEKSVKDILTEELGVTEEQVEEAMEILGISYLELMNPSQLSQLVAQLTQTEDTCQLLMDGSFRGIMQQVDALSRELTQEFGIPKEQLILLGSQMTEDSAGTATVFPAEEVNASDDVQPDVSVQKEALSDSRPEPTVQTVQAAGTQADVQKAQEQTMQPQEQTSESGEQKATVVKVNEVTQEDASMEQAEQENEGMDFQAGKGEAGQERHPVQTGEHAAFAVNHDVNPVEVEAPQPVTYTAPDVDVDSIMRQISEFARVNFSQENTTLEMQLNPQNLGRLYLHVSTTSEGNVTARIAATDETVKQLLEVQLADLRTSLNQQGIKVDAIEVTVASHEFERNLEQNAAGEQQQGEQQERGRSQGSRRLMRGELDELSGLMSEEEVLAARIMKDHGNTMDVTA